MSEYNRSIAVFIGGRIKLRMIYSREYPASKGKILWVLSVRDDWLHLPDEWFFLCGAKDYKEACEMLNKFTCFFATLSPFDSQEGFCMGCEKTANEVGKFFNGWPL